MHYSELKKLRHKANLKQQELADLLEVTQAQISWWENGKIKLNKVKQLALIGLFEKLGVR